MAIVIGNQLVNALTFGNAGYSGQNCIAKFSKGSFLGGSASPGRWYHQVVACSPQPPVCCQHGAANTVSLSTGGIHLGTPGGYQPVYNIVWNVGTTGPFILTKQPYRNLYDCAGLANATPSRCGWALTIGNAATGLHDWYDPASDTFHTETLPLNLDFVVGVGLSDDFKSQIWRCDWALWGCGHVNDINGAGFPFGPYHFPAACPAGQGYGFAQSVTLPEDPLDCVNFPVAALQHFGFQFSVSPT